MTKVDIKKIVKDFFIENPNTSPTVIINIGHEISKSMGDAVLAIICIMMEVDKTLITSKDQNGYVLLTYKEAEEKL